MRIALLTSFFPPDVYSGIARYVEDLALGLSAQGMDVTVIAAGSNSERTEQRGPLKIYWLHGRSREKRDLLFPSIHFLQTSFKMYRILKKLHLKKPFDIIEYPNTEFIGIASLTLGLPSPKPHYIVRMASPRSSSPKHGNLPRINDLLECWQAKFSDAYISHSRANLSICEKVYRLHSRKPKTVILLGLQKNIKPPPKSRTFNDKLNIFFLGRMNSRKGFDILASAWPSIASQIPEARLVVAGEDLPCEHGNSFFQWAIKDMPSSALEKLHYHGMVSSEFRDILYQEAYICVMPSRYESFGIVLLETMQYRLPTVSTNVGGIPEVIQNGITGVLVPPGDPIALSNAVINLLQDPLLYNKISYSADKELNNRFTIERVAQQTEDFYLSVRKLAASKPNEKTL